MTTAKEILRMCEKHEEDAANIHQRRVDVLASFARDTLDKIVNLVWEHRGPEAPRTYCFEIPSKFEDRFGHVEVDEEMRLALADHFSGKGFAVWTFSKLKPGISMFSMELSWDKDNR